jgi:hypothetical protein
VRSKAGKANARFLISTDLTLSAYELVTTYEKRWGIETGHKEVRFCGLDEGHVRSWHAVNNYDAMTMIAHAVAQALPAT